MRFTNLIFAIRVIRAILALPQELRAAADAFESAPSTRQRRDSAGSARSCDPPPINAALIEQRVLVAWNMTYAVRGGGK